MEDSHAVAASAHFIDDLAVENSACKSFIEIHDDLCMMSAYRDDLALGVQEKWDKTAFN
mgnify:CR=1 FL=1